MRKKPLRDRQLQVIRHIGWRPYRKSVEWFRASRNFRAFKFGYDALIIISGLRPNEAKWVAAYAAPGMYDKWKGELDL